MVLRRKKRLGDLYDGQHMLSCEPDPLDPRSQAGMLKMDINWPVVCEPGPLDSHLQSKA